LPRRFSSPRRMPQNQESTPEFASQHRPHDPQSLSASRRAFDFLTTTLGNGRLGIFAGSRIHIAPCRRECRQLVICEVAVLVHVILGRRPTPSTRKTETGVLSRSERKAPKKPLHQRANVGKLANPRRRDRANIAHTQRRFLRHDDARTGQQHRSTRHLIRLQQVFN